MRERIPRNQEQQHSDKGRTAIVSTAERILAVVACVVGQIGEIIERLEVPNPNASQVMPEDDWESRLGLIDWTQFQTAYGVATDVPAQLWRLRSQNDEDALSAAHDLWCGLCHQHVQIGSAALPALPFLLEVFATAWERLKIEILDILLGLAITSNPARIGEFAKAKGQSDTPTLPWIADVHAELVRKLPGIVALRMDANPDIAEFSRRIVEEIWPNE